MLCVSIDLRGIFSTTNCCWYTISEASSAYFNLKCKSLSLIITSMFFCSHIHSRLNIIMHLYIWLVAWFSGNAFDSINEVTLHWAGLVLGWVTASLQVNHFGM